MQINAKSWLSATALARRACTERFCFLEPRTRRYFTLRTLHSHSHVAPCTCTSHLHFAPRTRTCIASRTVSWSCTWVWPERRTFKGPEGLPLNPPQLLLRVFFLKSKWRSKNEGPQVHLGTQNGPKMVRTLIKSRCWNRTPFWTGKSTCLFSERVPAKVPNHGFHIRILG